MDSSSVISVSGLTKRFGEQLAVDDVTFDVPAGRITGFLGPNGAGKTTTLRILVGLSQPTRGTATILGRRYAQIDDPVRTVGAVIEGTGFHPSRRGIEELRVAATAGGVPLERCDEVLELVGLSAVGRRRVGAYSLGMRQRLSLAVAMLGDPQVLILDEPANGLDPEGILWVRRLLRHLADAQGTTVLVSSHLLGEVARLADDVIVIHHGKLVAQAPVRELTRGSMTVTLVRTPEADRLAAALREAGGEVQHEGDDALRVTGLDNEAVGRLALEAGVPMTELRRLEVDLEEVFLELTGEGRAIT